MVLLRSVGDTVNCLVLRSPRRAGAFQVRNSTELADSLLSHYGLEKSKPTETPGRRSTSMELTLAVVCHPTVAHTSAQSYNREQTRSETVASISQEDTKHLSSSGATRASARRNDGTQTGQETLQRAKCHRLPLQLTRGHACCVTGA